MALIYRSHFALAKSGLRTSYGLDTGPIYGFISTLVSLLEACRPSCVIVIFDSYFPLDTSGQSSPWQRRSIYPDYKANRTKMPTAIESSLPYIKALVSALGITIIEVANTEADDIIGSLVRYCTDNSFSVQIVSVDKDFLQLLQDSTCAILRPKTTTNKSSRRTFGDNDVANLSAWTLITEKDFRQNYDNLSPLQYCDILALMGDTADNIPGVAGVGEKQAVSLVKRFGCIESLVDNWKSISSPRLREKIFHHRELLLLSKTLVTIHQDVKIPSFDISDLFVRPPQLEKLNTIMEKLEFKKLRERIHKYIKNSAPVAFGSLLWKQDLVDSNGETAPSESKVESSSLVERMKKWKGVGVQYFYLSTLSNDDIAEEKWEQLLSLVRKQELPYIAFWIDYDVESKQEITLSPNTWNVSSFLENMWKKLLHEEFSFEDVIVIRGVVISWHSSTCIYFDWKHTKDAWIQQLEWLLCHSNISKTSIFVKKQLHCLEQFLPSPLSLPLMDIMVGYRIVAPFESLSIEQVIKRYALLGGDQDMLDMLEFMFSEMKNESFHDIHSDAAQSMISLFLSYPIEKDSLDTLRTWCQCTWTILLFRATKFLNSELTIHSMKTFVDYIEYRLIPVLATMERNGIYLDIEKLRHMSQQRNNNNKSNSSQRVVEAPESFFATVNMEDWNDDVQRIECIPKRKALRILQNQTNPTSRKLHVYYSRSSSMFGKLIINNLDTRGLVKSLVVAPQGYQIVVGDWTQIEMRILAALSKESSWIQVFIEQGDIHDFVANKLFRLERNDNQLPEHLFRTYAKILNFSILRGHSEQRISKELEIPRQRIKYWMELYCSSFPKVWQFLEEETVEKSFPRGYSETLLGRRIPLPFKDSQNYSEIAAAKNVCRRVPIEGTQADMISLAMIRIMEKWREYPKFRLLLQVGDQLIFQVAQQDCAQVVKLIESEVYDILPLPQSVPIQVRIGVGNNWLEATKRSLS